MTDQLGLKKISDIIGSQWKQNEITFFKLLAVDYLDLNIKVNVDNPPSGNLLKLVIAFVWMTNKSLSSN